ncbi:MAG: hypothetical protein ACRD0U_13435, partial [Acidimicrobiales bacterium]
MPGALGAIPPRMPSPSVPDRELDEESPSRHVGREALAVAVIAIVVCLSGIVAAASAPALHTTLASTGKAYLTDVSAQRAGPAESASTPTTTTTPTTTATTATT